MKGYRERRTATRVRQAKQRNSTALAKSSQRPRTTNPRGKVGPRNIQDPFAPPEEWHETTKSTNGYSVIVRSAGIGFRHVVSERQVRDRLADLPGRFVESLEVVQLSNMTRKKQSFPCYGMQWGTTIYLYPLEASLVETFYCPPRPAFYNESRMYGGRWKRSLPNVWTLHWSEQTIRDYYLNNILIHELGHLLDDRNTGYVDRERYAEWFAIEYGYRATGGRNRAGRRGKVQRRHHAK